MIGQSSPTDPLAAYAQRFAELEAQVAELKRQASRPVVAFWSDEAAGTTDASGDVTVTASTLSSITGGYGAQAVVAGTDWTTTVHTRSGNTFKIRFRLAGVAQASTGVSYTAWAFGPAA